MDTLTLEETLQICQAQEASRETQGQIKVETTYMDEVNKSGSRNKSAYKRSKFAKVTGGGTKGLPGDKCNHRRSDSCTVLPSR